MRIAVRVLLLGGALLVIGLMVVMIADVRAARRMNCQNNLRQLGIALGNYHDSAGRFPSATVGGTDLPPEQRLSWLTELYPAFLEGGIKLHVDRKRAWDAPENCPPRVLYKVEPGIHL